VHIPPSTTTPAPPRFWLRWILAVLLLGGFILFFSLGFHEHFTWDNVRGHMDDWKAEVAEHLVLAVTIYFAIYVAVTALSLPVAAPMSLAGGALFGFWVGTAVVSAASTLGATLAFLSSRYILRSWVQHRFGTRLDAINRGIDKDGAYYLFTLRLVPLFPFFLINLGMGLTSLRLRTFVWVSWLGMLPGTCVYLYAGATLSELQSPSDVASPPVLLALALLGLLPWLLRFVVRVASRDNRG
jgi:uncharacterized membrane protein YdjX (TVP38/TMEM64 family)